MSRFKNIPVALVYDKVNTFHGGAEHVLKSLKKIFPNAPLFTSVYDDHNAPWAENFKIVCSFLQKIPFIRNHHRILAPLMPLAFESLEFDDFDIVISITSGESKGVLTKPNQLHICYLLTPPRYVYSHREMYLNSHWFTKLPLLRQIAGVFLNYIEWWDRAAAFRPDYIIPISNLIKSRTKKYYGRKSENPIYPPVPKITADDDAFIPMENYYLSVSRLVDYKRIDLAILAAKKHGNKLVVAGNGPAYKKLVSIAGKSAAVRGNKQSLSYFFKRHKKALIYFSGSVSESELAALMSNCKALIMPGIEDFGITALQACLTGKPVILNKDSGAAEIIEDEVHGVHIKEESVESVVKALNKFEKSSFDASKIRNYAEKYGIKSFTSQFSKKVYDLFIHSEKTRKGRS